MCAANMDICFRVPILKKNCQCSRNITICEYINIFNAENFSAEKKQHIPIQMVLSLIKSSFSTCVIFSVKHIKNPPTFIPPNGPRKLNEII